MDVSPLRHVHACMLPQLLQLDIASMSAMGMVSLHDALQACVNLKQRGLDV